MLFRRFHISSIGRRKIADKKSRWSPLQLITMIGGGLVTALIFRKYVVLIVLNIFAFLFTPFLPDVTDPSALLANQSTVIYDRAGNELYTIHGEENRFEVPLAKIPTSLRLATIAAEDHDFYTHPGFDVDAIFAAVISEFGIGRPRGGSTITQQFVKNAYLSPERSYLRKFTELLLATKLENHFDKNKILEMYLNRIPYGSNAYGVEAAAQTFFAKDAKDLTLAESVVLAGLPQAPTYYSPYGAHRNELIGKCETTKQTTNDQQPTTDNLRPTTNEITSSRNNELTLTTTKLTWFKITDTTGKIIFTGNLKAGATKALTLADTLNVTATSTNYALTINGVAIKKPETKLTLTRIELDDFLVTSQELKVKKNALCTSPTDPHYTPGRKDYVLNEMKNLGFITEEQYLVAWTEANQLIFKQRREAIQAPHFVFFVREELEKKYGRDLVERGGLRVYTTLDPDLQTKAESLIESHFPHATNGDGTLKWKPDYADATNGSLLSMDNATGQILAMVGSRDYFEHPDETGNGNDGAVNLTTSVRQPGSSFKPFVYAAGFLQGFAPGSVLWDVTTNFGGLYEPKNFDGSQWGPISIRRALDGSRNIPAVKMATLAGEKNIVALGHKLGFTGLATDERYGPAIGLGVAEVSLLEMVRGYSVFANLGKKIEPTPFLKITDSQGNVIDEYETPKSVPLALDPAAAYLVTNILSDNSARPAGWNNYLALSRPNAAKTGTANRRYGKEKNDVLPGDIWTLGFTPQITTGVWIGNNDSSAMNLHGEGLTTVAPIWKAFMEFAHAKLPVENFDVPPNIVKRSISKLTGKLPSASTPIDQISVETFATWNIPLELDDAFVTLEVDKVSGKLPTAYTPESALVKRTFVNLHSERPNDPYWERPVAAWLSASPEKLAGEGNEDGFVLARPPTEYDDVHTAETENLAPQIRITTPSLGSVIGRKQIGVWVDVTASRGIEKVEYYRDGDLVATVTEAPWKGTLPIPLNAVNGTRYTIMAKIYDKMYYSTTSSVNVTVGETSEAPVVNILAPESGVTIPRGTSFTASATAFAPGGDITKVRFELDGIVIREQSTAPFEATLLIRNTTALGTHTLRVSATDTAGRETIASTEFEVGAGSGTLIDFSILSPSPGTTLDSLKTKSVEVIAQVNREKITPHIIEFLIRDRTTGAKTTLATLTDPAGETLTTTWSNFTPGEYELYLKIQTTDGQNLASGRNVVTVK